jgi:hypothetical protein
LSDILLTTPSLFDDIYLKDKKRYGDPAGPNVRMSADSIASLSAWQAHIEKSMVAVKPPKKSPATPAKKKASAVPTTLAAEEDLDFDSAGAEIGGDDGPDAGADGSMGMGADAGEGGSGGNGGS